MSYEATKEKPGFFYPLAKKGSPFDVNLNSPTASSSPLPCVLELQTPA
jgi:hypothetical protein